MITTAFHQKAMSLIQPLLEKKEKKKKGKKKEKKKKRKKKEKRKEFEGKAVYQSPLPYP